ncbi:hypothetical protein [Ramlibacter sp.]|uniref:hypothetical protein n=1 Tax=Ramlibacter sp. TaxID=1917967 RepID=UPI0017CC7503|nr:hypothetical protein [Ramlibacter sp.]MBA2675872.1 hypothetical protein [Ramlibacter sp.]
MRGGLLLAAAVSALALAACGDRTQAIGTGVRSDASAFQGASMPFTAPGWKPGDKGSWEQQLKTRAQNTQNDYAKVN